MNKFILYQPDRNFRFEFKPLEIEFSESDIIFIFLRNQHRIYLRITINFNKLRKHVLFYIPNVLSILRPNIVNIGKDV